MVPHLGIQILNSCIYLLWFYFVTDSEFSCLATLAKPYPVFGPTYLPGIHDPLHSTQNSAHQVLSAIYLA